MQGYFVIGAIIILIVFVLIRSRQMRAFGIKAIHFGEMDKKDFIIPPFVLLYFYMIVAHTFYFPTIGYILFKNNILGWCGVGLSVLAVVLFAWGIISFGMSFRVGLDEDKPGKLITSGAFAISRNPLYTAFLIVLFAVILIYPTIFFILYFGAGIWLMNRQIQLEEKSLIKTYGHEYKSYCKSVRRFL